LRAAAVSVSKEAGSCQELDDPRRFAPGF